MLLVSLQAYALISIGISFCIKMYFMFHLQLVLHVSLTTGINFTLIGIKIYYCYLNNFVYVQVVPMFVLSTRIWFKLVSKFILLTTRNFKICFKVASKFSFKICNVLLICKGCLTSPLYRIHVECTLHIEELDLSSLCGTRM